MGTLSAFSLMHMNNSKTYILLIASGLLLLADRAMAFPVTLGFDAVPDGGSTALLLVAGLGGVALLRRFNKPTK